jgi:hypothetical protein
MSQREIEQIKKNLAKKTPEGEWGEQDGKCKHPTRVGTEIASQ